jgi:N-acetylneuraminate synthase
MFSDLFVFELANNHQGDVNHGLKIIDALGNLKLKYNIKAAVKFQFRDYDSFIHPDAANDVTNDKIKRFTSTKLTWEEFKILIERVRSYNMFTMCTPFDESSVDYINKMDIDIIKVGSPSLYDWPLLEKIKHDSTKPVIVSSGGCDVTHVDKLVHFFKDKYLGLMHCVSIYPTPSSKLNLGVIREFRERYPKLTVGFSTHEAPDNTDAIKIAYTLGARMFEKHVGMDVLNAYSTSPEQTEKWIQSYLDTVTSIGNGRMIDETERSDLQKLHRGVFVNHDVKPGESVSLSDVFFAFPRQTNCITSGEFKPFVATRAYTKNDSIEYVPELHDTNIKKYVEDMRAYGRTGGIDMPEKLVVSHHYGTSNISDYGCIMYTIVDETLYSKKVIALLKNQQHPEHYHKIKTETFVVVAGSMTLVVDGVSHLLKKNETFTVKPYEKHSFSTTEGVIFEEIATSIRTVPDSFYTDEFIQNKSDKQRKTMFSEY